MIELDYDGFFVISASSGTTSPQYNYVNSFELYDPIEVNSSHHFQDSHARKAAHDAMFSGMSDTISDLIHNHDNDEEEDDFQNLETVDE